MNSKEDISRKEFLTLTFTLIGATAVGAGACDDDNNNATGGRGGTNGTAGRGGTNGTAGSGGNAGTTGTGGGGGTTASACSDPLAETQVQDSSMHTHSLMIPASALDMTTAQMFNTGITESHMHMVTLQPADLSALKGGGSVTATSTTAMAPGGPVHSHTFMVSCH